MFEIELMSRPAGTPQKILKRYLIVSVRGSHVPHAEFQGNRSAALRTSRGRCFLQAQGCNRNSRAIKLAGHRKVARAYPSLYIGFPERGPHNLSGLGERSDGDCLAQLRVDLRESLEFDIENGKRNIRSLCQFEGVLSQHVESS